MICSVFITVSFPFYVFCLIGGPSLSGMMVRLLFISISRLGDESRSAASAEPHSQTQNAGPSGRHSTLNVSGWAVYFSASGFSSSRNPISSRKNCMRFFSIITVCVPSLSSISRL